MQPLSLSEACILLSLPPLSFSRKRAPYTSYFVFNFARDKEPPARKCSFTDSHVNAVPLSHPDTDRHLRTFNPIRVSAPRPFYISLLYHKPLLVIRPPIYPPPYPPFLLPPHRTLCPCFLPCHPSFGLRRSSVPFDSIVPRTEEFKVLLIIRVFETLMALRTLINANGEASCFIPVYSVFHASWKYSFSFEQALAENAVTSNLLFAPEP